VIKDRFWWQLAHRHRRRQEKATNISCRQSAQRIRANPAAGSPQRKNRRTAWPIAGRQYP
jgi:hypothetical protein